MEQQIVSLATQCHMPVPVERQGKGAPRENSTDKENLLESQSSQQQAPKQKRAEPIAPYQALPVTADSVITHNITPALPVIEEHELSPEVRGGDRSSWVTLPGGQRRLHDCANSVEGGFGCCN